MADKYKDNSEPSAPLYPAVQTNTQDDILTQAPPPPYYEPLPPLHPQPNVMQSPPPAIYLAPINMPPHVGSSPTRLRCPSCQADIVTQIRHKSGCMTWAICGSICAIGLFAPCAWFGCQLIPFCIDSCKDVQHNCPNCRAYIGTHDRMK